MDCNIIRDQSKTICDKCKQPICEECSVDVNGNKICSSCIPKVFFSENRQYQKPAKSCFLFRRSSRRSSNVYGPFQEGFSADVRIYFGFCIV